MRIDQYMRVKLTWQDKRLAGAISDALLWYAVIISLVAARSWWLAGALVANQIVSMIVKRTVDRVRPDGSNDHSFYSGHTSTVFIVGAWLPAFVPLALFVGYLRMAANKHWLTDVIAGSLVGLAIGGLAKWLS